MRPALALRIVPALVLFAVSTGARADDSLLDPGFGAGGQRTVPFDLGGNGSDRAVKVLRRDDGSLVLVGTAASASGPRVAVAQLTAEGNLDANFGTAGRVNHDACMSEVTDAALDANGRILVVGNTTACGTGGSPDGRLVRLTAAGALDVDFSGGGVRNITFTTVTDAHERASALVVRANGEILVGGGVDNDGAGTTFTEVPAFRRLDGNGGNLAVVPGITTSISGRIVSGTPTSDGGVAWVVGYDAVLSAVSARIWRLTSNLVSDTSFATLGFKEIQSGGPETGCGTAIAHRPTSILLMQGNFKVFGFANVGGTLRSWYANVNDAPGGPGLRIRRLTDVLPGDVSILAAAPPRAGGDNATLAGICGVFQQCVLRVRVIPSVGGDFFELDPTFNGGLPVVLTYPAQPGNDPAGGALTVLRQPDGRTVVAGWRRWNTAGDDDFAVSRLGGGGPLLVDGFEATP
jgi:uncharacterized delta-60 repeat protein